MCNNNILKHDINTTQSDIVNHYLSNQYIETIVLHEILKQYFKPRYPDIARTP